MTEREKYDALRRNELAKLIKQLQYENENPNGSLPQKVKREKLQKEIKEIREELQGSPKKKTR